MNGFSLVELMLALGLGAGLGGVMLQGLTVHLQRESNFFQVVREKDVQRRVFDLIKNDLFQAKSISLTPGMDGHGCNLRDHVTVLNFGSAAGPITYSVGASPSSIWQGNVLMRCAPAYRLDGSIKPDSQAVNRVVIDRLAAHTLHKTNCTGVLGASSVHPEEISTSITQPVAVCIDFSTGLIGIRLTQELGGRNHSHLLSSSALIGVDVRALQYTSAVSPGN